ncbi:hypothetical protein BDN71DRAFT_1401803, partial [Pleurotus eryngii]
PSELGWWVGWGHKSDPAIERPADQYTAAWWAWWNAMQPKGQSLSGPKQVAELEDNVEWTVLDKPGINDFLSVVATLAWWATKLKPMSKASPHFQSWQNAIADVYTVMYALIDSKA